jgi:hypothetical protein
VAFTAVYSISVIRCNTFMNSNTLMNTPHARVGISLPRDLLERIRAEAEAAHRPISWQVALIARDYFQRRADHSRQE